VIADATFLRGAERASFMRLAREADAGCTLLWCDAPMEVLRERIAAREAAARDASEATLEVLSRQLEALEPPEPDADTVFCDSTQPASLAEARAQIARRCGLPGQAGGG